MPTIVIDQPNLAAGSAAPEVGATPTPSPDPVNHHDPPAPTTRPPLSPALETAGEAVSGSAAAAATWFRQLADGMVATKGERPPPPAVLPVQTESRVLDTFRRNPGSLIGHARAAQGRTMWSASLYVDDVTRLQSRLSASAAVLNAPGHAGTPAEIGPGLDEAGEAPPETIREGSAT
jgi:hypothetical protein